MTEDQLEQEALGWLADVGYTVAHGPELAPDGKAPERASYRQVLLVDRLRRAIRNLNPDIPQAAREDAITQLLNLGEPQLLQANRRFHRLLVGGVPVQYQKGEETRGDFVRLVDWAQPGRNEWLAVNQFSIQGPKHTRRPDVILFVNGLPLVLLELKNPADVNADVWKAFDQIQTYKEQIADAFHCNEVLVISDGTDALLGSLSADPERFMAWRTIDGVTLDPLGAFNELQTLVRGVLAPAYLLDYLRYFVLFEDDGTLVKKIAGYHQFHAVRAAITQVVAASRPDGQPSIRGKGGVVWHTQGSGKSITMTCFAARVMQEPQMDNPTIVVITDRNDLDGQLFGVFSLSQDLLREQPVQATTRQELRTLLSNRPSGGIVFATIQKFMPGEDEDAYPVLSDRRNIVVIVDEAHRLVAERRRLVASHAAPRSGNGPRRTHAATRLRRASGSALSCRNFAGSARPVESPGTSPCPLDAFEPQHPTKPIGPVYTKAQADELALRRHWVMAADGAGWRRVVPSPRPLRVPGLDVIRGLLGQGVLVIAAGGGGIPVVPRSDGSGLQGVEAVIDKDLCSALVATELQADCLIIATDVDAVYLDWGLPTQRAVGHTTPQALAAHVFAAGSMAPKVEAACSFVRASGRRAAIGALGDIEALLAGQCGTQIEPAAPEPRGA